MPKITKQTVKKKKVIRKRNKSDNVLDRIAPIGFDEDEGITISLYGRSGTGKTTLWATFPKPILAIICSGSSNADELRSIDTAENRKTIKQVVLNTPNDVEQIAQHQESTGEFATLVIDHVTSLQDLILKGILGLDEIPPQLSWGLATQQQYGACSLQLKTLLRTIMGLSCNVVIIAQERTFENENESDLDILPSIGSALSPSAAGWLNQASSYICQTFIRNKTKMKTVTVAGKSIEQRIKLKEVEYCLRTAPDPIYTTKFRVPKGSTLPPEIVDPTYDKIIKLIRQKG